MPLDEAAFRRTMSQLPTGVAVVTARVPRGRAVGMTASSVTSLSLEPPMLLVCVGRDSELHAVLLEAERFGVNVLAAGQVDPCQGAGNQRGAARRRDHLALLEQLPPAFGALARIECRRRGQLDGGDHTIVTGTLEWSEVTEGRPLCYFGGRYAELAR